MTQGNARDEPNRCPYHEDDESRGQDRPRRLNAPASTKPDRASALPVGPPNPENDEPRHHEADGCSGLPVRRMRSGPRVLLIFFLFMVVRDCSELWQEA